MKKQIEIQVKACDKCGEHRGELYTCIGCKTTLCKYCARKRLKNTLKRQGAKAVLKEFNLHDFNPCKTFRVGVESKFCDKSKNGIIESYKESIDGNISFCPECLYRPAISKVTGLLKACIRLEDAERSFREQYLDFEKKRDKLLKKVENLRHNARTKDVEAFWDAENWMNNFISGIEVDDDDIEIEGEDI